MWIDQPDPFSPAATLRFQSPTPGTYTVKATTTATWTTSCGDVITRSDKTTAIKFQVIGVKSLKYFQANRAGGGKFVDASGTIYVLAGKSLTFEATQDGPGTAFPTNQPTWSGTSGASGTGVTLSVTFATPSASNTDFKTVVVNCGCSSLTANVIVFDLAPTLTPRDNFADRDLSAYGVCEFIELSCLVLPSGVMEYDVGGLRWAIDTGGGEITGGAGATSVYQCPDVAATITLKAVIVGGAMLGQEKKADPKEVVAPDGAKVLRRPDTKLWHRKARCSVGFCGDYYATCAKVVSFKEIEVREGEGLSTAKGYYEKYFDKMNHEKSEWTPLKDVQKDKGYQWDVENLDRPYDKISSGALGAPYAPGTVKWPIANEYKKKGAANDTAKSYATATQEWESTATGKCTIRKAGSGDFSAEAGDDTVIPDKWNND
ncbi:MAG: hypothetical protein C0467_27760 [Planctomycetaceae bacterium]|nr:hypothetical protein [Planctomycetaceae bacterium]